MTNSVATLRLLAKCASMDLSALNDIADEIERLLAKLNPANREPPHCATCSCATRNGP